MGGSQSEAPTESKDPLPAGGEMDGSRRSHGVPLSALGELPTEPVALLAGMGSFDCVPVRFANGNFAQDDRFLGNEQKKKEN